MFHPSKMFAFLEVTYDNGLFSIFSRSNENNGSALSWFLESGGIFLMALVVVSDVYEQPYSEKNGTYYQKLELILDFVADPKSWRDDIQMGKAEFLRNVVMGEKSLSHSVLTLYHSDGDIPYITIVNKSSTGWGFWNTEENIIVKLTSIDQETATTILRLYELIQSKSS